MSNFESEAAAITDINAVVHDDLLVDSSESDALITPRNPNIFMDFQTPCGPDYHFHTPAAHNTENGPEGATVQSNMASCHSQQTHDGSASNSKGHIKRQPNSIIRRLPTVDNDKEIDSQSTPRFWGQNSESKLSGTLIHGSATQSMSLEIESDQYQQPLKDSNPLLYYNDSKAQVLNRSNTMPQKQQPGASLKVPSLNLRKSATNSDLNGTSADTNRSNRISKQIDQHSNTSNSDQQSSWEEVAQIVRISNRADQERQEREKQIEQFWQQQSQQYQNQNQNNLDGNTVTNSQQLMVPNELQTNTNITSDDNVNEEGQWQAQSNSNSTARSSLNTRDQQQLYNFTFNNGTLSSRTPPPAFGNANLFYDPGQINEVDPDDDDESSSNTQQSESKYYYKPFYPKPVQKPHLSGVPTLISDDHQAQLISTNYMHENAKKFFHTAKESSSAIAKQMMKSKRELSEEGKFASRISNQILSLEKVRDSNDPKVQKQFQELEDIMNPIHFPIDFRQDHDGNLNDQGTAGASINQQTVTDGAQKQLKEMRQNIEKCKKTMKMPKGVLKIGFGPGLDSSRVLVESIGRESGSQSPSTIFIGPNLQTSAAGESYQSSSTVSKNPINKNNNNMRPILSNVKTNIVGLDLKGLNNLNKSMDLSLRQSTNDKSSYNGIQDSENLTDAQAASIFFQSASMNVTGSMIFKQSRGEKSRPNSSSILEDDDDIFVSRSIDQQKFKAQLNRSMTQEVLDAKIKENLMSIPTIRYKSRSSNGTVIATDESIKDFINNTGLGKPRVFEFPKTGLEGLNPRIRMEKEMAQNENGSQFCKIPWMVDGKKLMEIRKGQQQYGNQGEEEVEDNCYNLNQSQSVSNFANADYSFESQQNNSVNLISQNTNSSILIQSVTNKQTYQSTNLNSKTLNVNSGPRKLTFPEPKTKLAKDFKTWFQKRTEFAQDNEYLHLGLEALGTPVNPLEPMDQDLYPPTEEVKSDNNISVSRNSNSIQSRGEKIKDNDGDRHMNQNFNVGKFEDQEIQVQDKTNMINKSVPGPGGLRIKKDFVKLSGYFANYNAKSPSLTQEMVDQLHQKWGEYTSEKELDLDNLQYKMETSDQTQQQQQDNDVNHNENENLQKSDKKKSTKVKKSTQKNDPVTSSLVTKFGNKIVPAHYDSPSSIISRSRNCISKSPSLNPRSSQSRTRSESPRQQQQLQNKFDQQNQKRQLEKQLKLLNTQSSELLEEQSVFGSFKPTIDLNLVREEAERKIGKPRYGTLHGQLQMKMQQQQVGKAYQGSNFQKQQQHQGYQTLCLDFDATEKTAKASHQEPDSDIENQNQIKGLENNSEQLQLDLTKSVFLNLKTKFPLNNNNHTTITTAKDAFLNSTTVQSAKLSHNLFSKTLCNNKPSIMTEQKVDKLVRKAKKQKQLIEPDIEGLLENTIDTQVLQVIGQISDKGQGQLMESSQNENFVTQNAPKVKGPGILSGQIPCLSEEAQSLGILDQRIINHLHSNRCIGNSSSSSSYDNQFSLLPQILRDGRLQGIKSVEELRKQFQGVVKEEFGEWGKKWMEMGKDERDLESFGGGKQKNFKGNGPGISVNDVLNQSDNVTLDINSDITSCITVNDEQIDNQTRDNQNQATLAVNSASGAKTITNRAQNSGRLSHQLYASALGIQESPSPGARSPVSPQQRNLKESEKEKQDNENTQTNNCQAQQTVTQNASEQQQTQQQLQDSHPVQSNTQQNSESSIINLSNTIDIDDISTHKSKVLLLQGSQDALKNGIGVNKDLFQLKKKNESDYTLPEKQILVLNQSQSQADSESKTGLLRYGPNKIQMPAAAKVQLVDEFEKSFNIHESSDILNSSIGESMSQLSSTLEEFLSSRSNKAQHLKDILQKPLSSNATNTQTQTSMQEKNHPLHLAKCSFVGVAKLPVKLISVFLLVQQQQKKYSQDSDFDNLNRPHIKVYYLSTIVNTGGSGAIQSSDFNLNSYSTVINATRPGIPSLIMPQQSQAQKNTIPSSKPVEIQTRSDSISVLTLVKDSQYQSDSVDHSFDAHDHSEQYDKLMNQKAMDLEYELNTNIYIDQKEAVQSILKEYNAHSDNNSGSQYQQQTNNIVNSFLELLIPKKFPQSQFTAYHAQLALSDKKLLVQDQNLISLGLKKLRLHDPLNGITLLKDSDLESDTENEQDESQDNANEESDPTIHLKLSIETFYPTAKEQVSIFDQSILAARQNLDRVRENCQRQLQQSKSPRLTGLFVTPRIPEHSLLNLSHSTVHDATQTILKKVVNGGNDFTPRSDGLLNIISQPVSSGRDGSQGNSISVSESDAEAQGAQHQQQQQSDHSQPSESENLDGFSLLTQVQKDLSNQHKQKRVVKEKKKESLRQKLESANSVEEVEELLLEVGEVL